MRIGSSRILLADIAPSDSTCGPSIASNPYMLTVKHQAQPYQLIASNYVIEVELGHFDGAVGAKVTSKERTRIVRWDFH